MQAAVPPVNTVQPPEEKGIIRRAFNSVTETLGGLFGSGEPEPKTLSGGGSRSRSRNRKIKKEKNYYAPAHPAGAPVMVVGPNPLNKVTRSGKHYGGGPRRRPNYATKKRTRPAYPQVSMKAKPPTLRNVDPLGFGIYNQPHHLSSINLGTVHANMTENEYKRMVNRTRKNKSGSRSRSRSRSRN